MASSCLTLGMAKDWAKAFPRADKAIKTGTTRVTKALRPQTCVTQLAEPTGSVQKGGREIRGGALTFSKNCAATVTSEVAISSLLIAAN